MNSGKKMFGTPLKLKQTMYYNLSIYISKLRGIL